MKSDSVMKPMSVARYEFVNNLTDLINSCMLPPFVIEDILRDTYTKISAISKQQLEKDMKTYKEALGGAVSNDTSI